VSEYDLKKSEKGIGQLYPILEAKDGEVIDGFHREEADKNWKRLRLEHIDTEEKKLVARLVANFHRRQITREEKEKWINGLAEIYKKQGLEASSKLQEKIAEVTGLSTRTIREYLGSEFKDREIKDRELSPRVPASQRIERQLGVDVVERHREEVLAQEKPKIEQQVKTKLLKSPEFQREIIKEISKPRIITPSEPCPSGVCELPSRIDAGEPIDVRAESLAKFWQTNPECLCKKCEHYGKCGVFR